MEVNRSRTENRAVLGTVTLQGLGLRWISLNTCGQLFKTMGQNTKELKKKEQKGWSIRSDL